MTRTRTKTIYQCHYSFSGPLQYRVEIPDIATAKEGFWIDINMQYTNGSDAKTWVSPSSVICVEKEYREVL